MVFSFLSPSTRPSDSPRGRRRRLEGPPEVEAHRLGSAFGLRVTLGNASVSFVLLRRRVTTDRLNGHSLEMSEWIQMAI